MFTFSPKDKKKIAEIIKIIPFKSLDENFFFGLKTFEEDEGVQIEIE